VKINIDELEKIVSEKLSSKYSDDELNLMLPVIMFGELSNTKSHGILRIPSIINKIPNNKPLIHLKTQVSKIIEGNGNPGMLVGALACNEAIKIGKDLGVGMVGTHGSVSSSGCLSYYAEKMAKENIIGIVMARAPGDVAPYRGLERLFGTNPIAFGIPADERPLIFDMSTSAISWGAVDRAKKMGEKLPDKVAIDKTGKITNDPTEALEGAFLTFDNSYKGYGLSMMVEILAGILPGADFLDLGQGDEWGNIFIAIHPNSLSSVSEFKKKVRILIEKVRKSKSVDGKDIRIPGEERISNRNNSLEMGKVEVDEQILKMIRQ
jgi:L-2-hydroxycarboxylate dehydrogenase (NAD+)